MSGYASYDVEVRNTTLLPTFEVATDEDLHGIAHLVDDFDAESVTITDLVMLRGEQRVKAWVPKQTVEGNFTVWRDGPIVKGCNEAVVSGEYNVAKFCNGGLATREANYHPESSQVIFPQTACKFALFLGASPDKMACYVFDGTRGVSIHPGTWHQPPVPVGTSRMTFRNKQSKSHLCVMHDTVFTDNHWWLAAMPPQHDSP